MKKKRIFQGGILLSALLINACKDPLEHFELNVGTEILHYTNMIQVEDGNGQPISNITAAISGPDAALIYNLAGYKNFTINGGLLGLGIHPEHDPTKDREVRYDVSFSGSGYLTQVVPVVISEQQPYSVQTVHILNLDNPPPGVRMNQSSLTLQNNTLLTDATLATTIGNQATGTADIKLLQGTSFLDRQGAVIPGDHLNLRMVYLDASVEKALGAFPGGSLNSANVLAEGGTVVTSGSFNPAAVVAVDFFIGASPVKKFSQPVTLSIGLDAAFYNITTSALLKAGDQLSVYSYDVTTAQWQFEKYVTVEMKNGKPVASFETSHLSWYMVGNYLNSCTNPAILRFSGNWMIAGNTYPLKVEALLAGKVLKSLQVSLNTSSPIVNISDLPLSSKGISIRVYTADGQLLTAATGVELPSGSCTDEHIIALNPPVYNSAKVTLQLYVRCPEKKSTVKVLPTFYLYYREAKTSADDTGFKLLGVVKNGLLSTSLLTVDSKVYDFKAIWGNNIKYAYKKTVKADNSATVGTAPGDIIGVKVGANNLEMLTENCQ